MNENDVKCWMCVLTFFVIFFLRRRITTPVLFVLGLELLSLLCQGRDKVGDHHGWLLLFSSNGRRRDTLGFPSTHAALLLVLFLLRKDRTSSNRLLLVDLRGSMSGLRRSHGKVVLVKGLV